MAHRVFFASELLFRSHGHMTKLSSLRKLSTFSTLFNLSRCNMIKQNSLMKSPYVSIRFYSSFPPHIVINLPNLSPTMETGTVVSWAKAEGDQLNEGDLLAEIETDKATMSLDANDAGFLAKILVATGTKDVPVGTPLCIVVSDEADVPKFKEFKSSDLSKGIPVKSAPLPAPPAQTSAPPAQTSAPPVATSSATPVVAALPVSSGGPVFASPYARSLAKEQGIDLNQLAAMNPTGGSGVFGSYVSTDLKALVGGLSGGPVSQPRTASGAQFADMPLSNMRAVIAKRLTESKTTVPHYYLTVDVRLDAALALRAQANKLFAASAGKTPDGKPAPGVTKLSVNDLILKAAAVACQRVPECNSAWHGDFIRQYNNVDICVAVATPNGLITPIVFNAEQKGLHQINKDVMELAAKARANKLQPHEFQGGTFTVSNLGMFGVSCFSAIINPPQACILAVGGSQTRLMPDPSAPSGYAPANLMAVTLCCDHRVVDGAVGAKWLVEFRSVIEQPGLMIV